MALIYKDSIYHGDGCQCCEMTTDAASAIDPTGTRPIRRAMRSLFLSRWRSVRIQVRAALLKADMLGLSSTSPMSMFAAAQPGADKVKGFQSFIDAVMQREVVGVDVSPFVARGYAKGAAFGRAVIGVRDPAMSSNRQHDREQTLSALTKVEFQGVVEAVSQRAVRAVADGLLHSKKAAQITRDVLEAIDAVGITRGNTVIELVIVKAFNEATLDIYEADGRTTVNLVPEHLVSGKLTADARRKGPGSRSSRKRTPSPSTIARIAQAEGRLAKLNRVRVVTAGDNDVCPICEGIAQRGPYSINRARALIPAHPHCRCVFVAA